MCLEQYLARSKSSNFILENTTWSFLVMTRYIYIYMDIHTYVLKISTGRKNVEDQLNVVLFHLNTNLAGINI